MIYYLLWLLSVIYYLLFLNLPQLLLLSFYSFSQDRKFFNDRQTSRWHSQSIWVWTELRQPPQPSVSAWRVGVDAIQPAPALCSARSSTPGRIFGSWPHKHSGVEQRSFVHRLVPPRNCRSGFRFLGCVRLEPQATEPTALSWTCGSIVLWPTVNRQRPSPEGTGRVLSRPT